MTTSEVNNLKDELGIAFGFLEGALDAAFKAEEQATAARQRLADARAMILTANAADPKALGGNEAAREAKLAELTSESVADVRAADETARRAKHLVSIGREKMDYVRAKVRLAEVAAGIVRNF